jgi:hypothetical protein
VILLADDLSFHGQLLLCSRHEILSAEDAAQKRSCQVLCLLQQRSSILPEIVELQTSITAAQQTRTEANILLARQCFDTLPGDALRVLLQQCSSGVSANDPPHGGASMQLLDWCVRKLCSLASKHVAASWRQRRPALVANDLLATARSVLLEQPTALLLPLWSTVPAPCCGIFSAGADPALVMESLHLLSDLAALLRPVPSADCFYSSAYHAAERLCGRGCSSHGVAVLLGRIADAHWRAQLAFCAGLVNQPPVLNCGVLALVLQSEGVALLAATLRNVPPPPPEPAPVLQSHQSCSLPAAIRKRRRRKFCGRLAIHGSSISSLYAAERPAPMVRHCAGVRRPRRGLVPSEGARPVG